ncbi:M10 family metallopeptidase C-terminal domain-containing protein [Pseudomonas sp. SDO5271_S396]
MQPKTAEAIASAPAPSSGTTQALNELSALLTPANLGLLLRSPNDKGAKALLEQLRSLLSPGNIASLLRGPDAEANAKVLKTIGKQLSKETVSTQRDSALDEVGKNYKRQETLNNVAMLPQSFDGGGLESDVSQQNNIQKRLSGLKRQLSEIQTVGNALIGIGESLTADKIDAARGANDAPLSASNGPATYRYRSIEESTLGTPSEIRNFNRNDKLDLSDIQRQTGKPLHLVEHFSGAPGEMQIHYLPGTHTSVIAINGNPGQPPMVIKVFGEVRHSNLVL